MAPILLVERILGVASEERFAGRRVERFGVSSSDAAKRRLRGTTDEGTDVAVDLARGSYLRHGAVLDDDGERIVVVERMPEQALVVRLASGVSPTEALAAGAAVGHAFGNQHVPVEITGAEIRVPITTSAELARKTLESLGLASVAVSLELVRLGCERPVVASHGH
jgi:urease accessory protein UreE